MERDGVLASWAVPKGLPREPDVSRLAVHTEDHPLEYAAFDGEIPAGEYGAGTMTIWDHGRYETLHWNDHVVEVVFHGERAQGRYRFVNIGGEDKAWQVKRVEPAPEGWAELPAFVRPMSAQRGELPEESTGDEWAYEFDWDGQRAIVRVQGGRATLFDETATEITATYPELRAIGKQLGSTEALLDGEIVVFEHGLPNREALGRRQAAAAAQAKRLVTAHPVMYLPYDLLHLDGRACLAEPYLRRRELLAELGLTGPNWQVPEHYVGGGDAVVRASETHGLAGVVAKRAGSGYRPGKRSPDWIAVSTRKTGADA
ncbi:MAG: bifunctional non-ous end joining protein LigD [Actinomycetota bacterium]|nr:bifunctional non-ous end joining protein LigD [Actinomycetota bacterium]